MEISKISFWCLASFIAGVGLASFLFLPVFVYLPLFIAGLIIWILVKPSKNIWLGFVCLVFLVLGAVRYESASPDVDENHLAFYNDQKIVFQGKVLEEPDKRNNKIELTIGRVVMDGREMTGRVLVSAPFYSDYQYGDELEIEGKLEKPGVFEDFNYHEYLARYDIYSIGYFPKIRIIERGAGNFLSQKLLFFKTRVKNLIEVNFTEPHATILSALLLGLKSQIPQEVRDWFSRAGLSHVLAISGLHITILTKLIMIFLVSGLLIRRQLAFWFVGLIIVFFVILVGAPASAVRAAIMGLSLLFAEAIGRPQAGIRTLVLAAGIMLAVNPKLLGSDIGFQLSFGAVLGLSFFGQYFNRRFQKIPNPRYLPLRYYLSATLSAQVFVFPLVLYYFGNLSLAAPLANIMVLPLLPGVMVLGILVAAGGIVWPFLAQIFFWPAWIGLTYILLVARLISRIPYLSFVFSRFSLAITVILYILIIFWLIYVKKKESENSYLAS